MKVGDLVTIIDRRYANIAKLGHVMRVGESTLRIRLMSGKKLTVSKGDAVPSTWLQSRVKEGSV